MESWTEKKNQNKTAIKDIIIHLGNSEYGQYDDRLYADSIVTPLNILVILMFGVFVV